MAAFDMPVDQLPLYNGSNPRPADFDQYWNRALAEMNTVEPAVTLEPADFQSSVADCFHMTFTGVRGARIYAKLLKPKGNPRNCPAVLMFHGYSGNSGEWRDKLAFVAEGFVVAAMDCRGQGGRSQDTGGMNGNTYEGMIVRGLGYNPDDMLMRHIMLDTAQLAGLIMALPEVDETRVMATGGSQGGGLSLACASLEPRINRLAIYCPFLSDYKRVWDMGLAQNSYDEITYYFRHFDPLHEREDKAFTQLGYVDVQHLAPRIRGQVLMATGMLDRTCPPSTQFAAYNRIDAPKEVRLYPDFAHETYPGFGDMTHAFFRSDK
ncbi:acetylxylan esterase [Ruminococcaceae bacterium OttesenSCG-928-L11]|nr:acetylxylan esterase [Ruminococcaceae bacterium OttesenSCG-928-L11]